MMQIIKILIWSFWLFCCNCLVAFLFVVIGSLIFHYHIHFYAGLIGGAVMLVVYFGGLIGWLAYLIPATIAAVMTIAAIRGD